jgi:hypothetical protein
MQLVLQDASWSTETAVSILNSCSSSETQSACVCSVTLSLCVWSTDVLCWRVLLAVRCTCCYLTKRLHLRYQFRRRTDFRLAWVTGCGVFVFVFVFRELCSAEPRCSASWHVGCHEKSQKTVVSGDSPSKIRQIKSRRMRWAGHVARMGGGRNFYRVLVGKPERKRLLERQRRRWEDGIKMDLREIGWGGVEWIHLAQDRDRWRAVVNAGMNIRVLAPRSEWVSELVS